MFWVAFCLGPKSLWAMWGKWGVNELVDLGKQETKVIQQQCISTMHSETRFVLFILCKLNIDENFYMLIPRMECLCNITGRGGRYCSSVTFPAHNSRCTIWSSQLLRRGPDSGIGLHVWLNFYWDAVTWHIRFSYSEGHMIRIIFRLCYGKELMFSSTQKFNHITEECWTLWVPRLFVMFVKGQNKYSGFNHKHRIIKFAMWMCNFCQK